MINKEDDKNVFFYLQVFTLTDKGVLHHHDTNIVLYLLKENYGLINPKDYKWVYSPSEVRINYKLNIIYK